MDAKQEQHRVKEKVHRYPCPGCAAALVFEPAAGALVCPYCGRREAIPNSAEQVQEHSYLAYLRPRSAQLQRLAEDALTVTCDSCGATVTFTPPDVAGECNFCGTNIVAQPQSSDPIVAPECVLPFRLTQQQAADALKQWLSTRWFAPNGLKKFAAQESIGGIYLPFWSYDAHTDSYYTGARGEHYYQTETYTETDAQGKSETKTRQVQRTAWTSASGKVSRWFDDILVPAARSLPPKRIAALEPWDLAELTPYDPRYISGYKAQHYQLKLDEGFEQAKQLAAQVIDKDVRDDIGGDEQRVDNITTHYSGVTFKHLLLPVYAGAYRFKEQVYQVVVNGRTGEVLGDRPYSIWKITLLVLLCLLLIAGLIFLWPQDSG